MCPIKMLVSGKNQHTCKLPTSKACHLNTPAVHKHYDRIKYSCTTEHDWVLQNHTVTSMHSALTFLTQSIIINDLHICIMRLWMLITRGQMPD
jgi:hypothetical protein